MEARTISRPLRVAGFAVVFTLAGLLGRATIVGDREIALFWPAAGVAVLWCLVEDVRWRSVDVLVLAVAAFAVNTATGAPPDLGAFLILVNVSQALIAASLCRRWVPGLVGRPGERLRSSRELMGLVLAAACGVLVGTAIGVLGLWVTSGALSAATTAVWWGRNAVGALAVAAAGLLVLDRWATRGAVARRPSPAWWAELAAVVAVTAALFLVEEREGFLPVSFLLPGVLVWVGMRFSPVVAGIHGLVAGVGFVLVTLSGEGPFAAVASEEYAALLSQLFVGISAVLGMVLALYRQRTSELLVELGAARRESEHQADVLGTVISSMWEGVVVMDAAGVVRMSNPAAARIFGTPIAHGRALPEQMSIRWPDGTTMADEDRPSRRAALGQPVEGVDCVVEVPEGVRVLQISAASLGEQTLSGGSSGVVVAFRDVTDERARQRDLAAFAGVVAHDLMNPIGSVDGWAEQLEEAVQGDGERGEHQRGLELGMVRRIRSSSARMRALVRDLLAHATSTDRSLQPETLDLAGAVTAVAVERGVLDCVRVGAIPPVHADAMLVRQLLDNLVGNAVKYVRPDAVADVEVSGTPHGEAFVRVTVADRGVGIPEGQHEAVFQDFHRAHPDYPGTGLGLAICRRIVDRHGGRIAARPREGGGTLIELTLPARAKESAPDPVPTEEPEPDHEEGQPVPVPAASSPWSGPAAGETIL